MGTKHSSKRSINDWDRFANFKQRGEWVELLFMAKAAQRRFAISNPWGDTQAYDVGIEHGSNFLRVQVKSTTVRVGAGYRCQFMPNHFNPHPDSRNLAYSARSASLICPAVLLFFIACGV